MSSRREARERERRTYELLQENLGQATNQQVSQRNKNGGQAVQRDQSNQKTPLDHDNNRRASRSTQSSSQRDQSDRQTSTLHHTQHQNLNLDVHRKGHPENDRNKSVKETGFQEASKSVEPLQNKNDQRRVRFTDAVQASGSASNGAARSSQDAPDALRGNTNKQQGQLQGSVSSTPSADHQEPANSFSSRNTIFVGAGGNVSWSTSHNLRSYPKGVEQDNPGSHDAKGNAAWPILSRVTGLTVRNSCRVVKLIIGSVVVVAVCHVALAGWAIISQAAQPFLWLYRTVVKAGLPVSTIPPVATLYNPSTTSVEFSPVLADLGSILSVILRTESGVRALAEMSPYVEPSTQLSSAVSFLNTLNQATNVEWTAHLRSEQLILSHLILQQHDLAEFLTRDSEWRVGFPRWLCQLPYLSNIKLCRVSLNRFLSQLDKIVEFISDMRLYRFDVLKQHMTSSTTGSIRNSICKLGDMLTDVGVHFGQGWRKGMHVGHETESNQSAGKEAVISRVGTYLGDHREGLRMSCDVAKETTAFLNQQRVHMEEDVKALHDIFNSLLRIKRDVADGTLDYGRAIIRTIEQIQISLQRLASWSAKP